MFEADAGTGQAMLIQQCPALQSWKVPDHPLITPLPYYPGFAEYAALVRHEIVCRRDRSFAIAVDLPHGLEKPVLEAVKALPAPSLIIDPLSRGIPVLPSSAPIEAVRSYLEFGCDLRFVDACLPVTGSMVDYLGFIQACRRFGIETVMGDPISYGVHPEELFRSWVTSDEQMITPAPFPHSPDVYLRRDASSYNDETASPYLRTRLAYMAEKVRELEDADVEILLVCDARHMGGILHHLRSESDPIDDTYVTQTRTTPLLEMDIRKVTEEVPFFAYLYELYRDAPFNRRTWLQHLVREASGPDDASNHLCAALAYAEKIALTYGDSAPGLLHLIAAARTICGDEYSISLLEKALSYPPAEEPQLPGARRSVWVFLGALSLLGRGVGNLNPSLRILDFDFMPIRGCELIVQGCIEILEQERRRGSLEYQLANGTRRKGWYSRWTRTPESYRAEREFTDYVLARFPVDSVRDDDWYPIEYQTSMELGIDLRESLRYSHLDRIYVRRPEAAANACYVFDYRGYHSSRHGGMPEQAAGETQKVGHLNHFFFDRYLDWAGVGVETGLHYESAVMAMFTRLHVPVTEIFSTITSADPLASTVSLGLEHGDRVTVFTNRPEELTPAVARGGRVVCRPLNAIPAPVLDRMAAFDISHYRHEDTRGD